MQIEALEEVERAFVHVDYASRELPEHKVRSLPCMRPAKGPVHTPFAAIMYILQAFAVQSMWWGSPKGQALCNTLPASVHAV